MINSNDFNLMKKKIVAVLRRNHIKKAGIFGSYARNKQKKSSDVDILVEIKDKKMSLLGFIGLKHELEDAIGKKVDLVEYCAIKPRIREQILNEEIRII